MQRGGWRPYHVTGHGTIHSQYGSLGPSLPHCRTALLVCTLQIQPPGSRRSYLHAAQSDVSSITKKTPLHTPHTRGRRVNPTLIQCTYCRKSRTRRTRQEVKAVSCPPPPPPREVDPTCTGTPLPRGRSVLCLHRTPRKGSRFSVKDLAPVCRFPVQIRDSRKQMAPNVASPCAPTRK